MQFDAPEQKRENTHTHTHTHKEKNCTTSTMFHFVSSSSIYDLLLAADALALFSCCFPSTFSPLI